MKTPRVLFSVLVAILLFSACNHRAQRARIYHDNLVHEVRVAMDSIIDYGDAIQSHNKNRIKAAQQQCSSLVNKTMENIKRMGSFEGDTSLASSSLKLMELYRNSFDKGFTPVLNTSNTDSFTVKEMFTADSLYAALIMAENNTWAGFDSAEKRFYRQYELKKTGK